MTARDCRWGSGMVWTEFLAGRDSFGSDAFVDDDNHLRLHFTPERSE